MYCFSCAFWVQIDSKNKKATHTIRCFKNLLPFHLYHFAAEIGLQGKR